MKNLNAQVTPKFRIQLALALFMLAASPMLRAATFQSLSSAYAGSLDSSSGWSISGDGTTIVGNLTPFRANGQVGTQTAFRWEVGSAPELLPFTNATDVSYDGSVVVGERYRWTQATGAQDIGQLGSLGAAAYGVSRDGSVVVGFSDGPNGREAYRWTQSGGMQGLGFLSAANSLSRASDVSGDGSIVVGSGYGGAFQWTQATGMIPLATTGPLKQPFLGQPNVISADGSTVAGQSPQAWLWTAAGGLNFLGFNQAVYGLSADGSVAVGGDQWSSDSGIAFIWDSVNGARPLQDYLQNDLGLNINGWTLYAALGISDDGTKIVGVGTNPYGVQEAWYADVTAVPEPAVFYQLLAGLFVLAGIARRKLSI